VNADEVEPYVVKVATTCPHLVGDGQRCGTVLTTGADRPRAHRRANYYRHVVLVHPSLSARERSVLADRLLAGESGPFQFLPRTTVGVEA
jgi:hypothetical protein